MSKFAVPSIFRLSHEVNRVPNYPCGYINYIFEVAFYFIFVDFRLQIRLVYNGETAFAGAQIENFPVFVGEHTGRVKHGNDKLCSGDFSFGSLNAYALNGVICFAQTCRIRETKRNIAYRNGFLNYVARCAGNRRYYGFSVPVSIFIRVDLPTFGLPTIAVSVPSVIA